MIHGSVPNVGRQNQNISTPGVWQSRRRSSEPKHINARRLAVTTQKRQNEEQIEPLTNNQIKKNKSSVSNQNSRVK